MTNDHTFAPDSPTTTPDEMTIAPFDANDASPEEPEAHDEEPSTPIELHEVTPEAAGDLAEQHEPTPDDPTVLTAQLEDAPSDSSDQPVEAPDAAAEQVEQVETPSENPSEQASAEAEPAPADESPEPRTPLNESSFRRERIYDADAAMASLDETVLRPLYEPIDLSDMPQAVRPTSLNTPPFPGSPSPRPRNRLTRLLAGAAAIALIVGGAVGVRALTTRTTNVGLTGLVTVTDDEPGSQDKDRTELPSPVLSVPTHRITEEEDSSSEEQDAPAPVEDERKEDHSTGFNFTFRSPYGEKDTGYEEDPVEDYARPDADADESDTYSENQESEVAIPDEEGHSLNERWRREDGVDEPSSFDYTDPWSWYDLIVDPGEEGSDPSYNDDSARNHDYDDLLYWYDYLTDIVEDEPEAEGTEPSEENDAYTYYYDEQTQDEEGYDPDDGERPYSYTFDDEGFSYTYGDQTYTLTYEDIMRFFGGDLWGDVWGNPQDNDSWDSDSEVSDSWGNEPDDLGSQDHGWGGASGSQNAGPHPAR